MGMPVPQQRWTREQVLALPDDGRRRELLDGELVVTPAPSRVHQRAVAALCEAMLPYVRRHGLGELLMAPADLSLEDGEILQPDLFVIPPEQADGADWRSVRHLLLAVEVASPASRRTDRLTKRRRYQRAGVPEYWVVDLDDRLVERWEPGDDRPAVLEDTLVWSAGGAPEPLVIHLPAFFRRVWRDGER